MIFCFFTLSILSFFLFSKILSTLQCRQKGLFPRTRSRMSSAVPDLGLTAKPTSALLWRAAPVHRSCALHAQCLTPQCQSQFQMLESSAAAALWRAVPARASSNQCAPVKRNVLHCCCGGAPLTFPLCTLKRIERDSAKVVFGKNF